MKILSKLSVIACLCWATLASCESPDYETGRTAQVNGLMSVTIQIPGNPSKFAATKTGPYEENEEIIVKVPTTDETPLDLTRLICMVNVEHNCYVTPAVGGEMDFTNPYPITVVDALGNKHHNTIRVVPTPPKTKYAKLWEKNAALLNMSSNTTHKNTHDDCTSQLSLPSPGNELSVLPCPTSCCKHLNRPKNHC